MRDPTAATAPRQPKALTPSLPEIVPISVTTSLGTASLDVAEKFPGPTGVTKRAPSLTATTSSVKPICVTPRRSSPASRRAARVHHVCTRWLALRDPFVTLDACAPGSQQVTSRDRSHAGVAKWQTRGTQNPVGATSCRFKSDLRHLEFQVVAGACFAPRGITRR